MGTPAITREPRASPSAPVGAEGIETVVFILADGVRADVLRALSESGDLPNITRHLMATGSYLEGVTVLPSATDVAYLPILTGQYPGTANIPGIRWVDKSRFAFNKLFLTGHRSYVGPTHLKFDADLPEDLETLFELCPGSLAVRSDIHRGLSPGRNRFYKMSGPFMFLSHYLRRAAFIDGMASASLFRALHSTNGNFPRFVFVPLIDVDNTSHNYGPQHARTINAYRRIDGIVGALVDRLKQLGVWDRTHLLFSSDHGHTETTEHLGLSRLVSELGYNVFEHPHVFRNGVDAAVMVSGNSFASIYVASDGRWERPLVAEELESDHQRLLDVLRRRVEIEWAAYRQGNETVKVLSRSGEAVLGKQGESYTYHHDGSDPLQLGLPHTTIHESDALDLTAGTQFPDALEQLWYLFASERTGDVVVTAKPGYDLRKGRERPEHHSSHGALCREHMIVPILSNRPLAAEGPVRTVDLFSTVIESLGLSPGKPHFGRSLW